MGTTTAAASTLARRVPAILALLTLIALPTAVLAQGEQGNVCVRDYRAGAVCTANDVRIEELVVVSVTEACNAGVIGETEVVFETLVSAAGSPDRYDIGLFVALDGGSARDGDMCYHDFLAPPLTATPTYGDKNSDTVADIDGGPWWNGDTDGDSCGDIESNTQVFTTLPSLRFACIDNNGDGSADVSVCTSWDNNTGSACNTVVDAFPGTNSKCSCGGVELGITPAPELSIEKSPASQNVLSGGTAMFSFSVTSRTTIQNVVVSDPDCDAAPLFTGGDTNNDTVLTPDETWTYTCSKSGVTTDFTNTVTVTGDAPLGPVSDMDSANVIVSTPAMTLVKTGTLVDGGDGADAGDTINYTFDVTNTGNVTLNNIAVTDPLPGLSAISCPGGNPIPSLAPMATVQCTASYTVTQVDMDNGAVNNMATADSDETAPVADTDSVTLPDDPSLTLIKTGVLNDGGDGADAGETIDYTFDVTNTGNVTLVDILVTDVLMGLSPVTCPGGNPIPSLAPMASVQCAASYTVTQADVDSGSVNNTATAETEQAPPVMDSDTVPLPAAPALALAKSGAFDDGGDGADAGDSIDYLFDVTNTGNVTLTNVAVTDPLPGLSAITCPGGNPVPSLAPAATVQCMASYAVTQGDIDSGQVDNTATADSDQTAPVIDSETVPLVSEPAATLVKTGTLDDGGDGVDAGDAINYTFAVTNTGNVTLTNITVSDPLPGLSAITCPGGNPVPSLAPAATIQCTASYSVTQGDIDSGAVDNTATVDSDQTPPVTDSDTVPLPPAAGITLVKSGTLDDGGDGADVSDTIAYTFAVTNTGNVTLTSVAVTDPLPGLSAITCPGGNPVPTLAPGASIQCTASYAVVQGDLDRGQVDNTATADSDQVGPVQDSATVPMPAGPSPAEVAAIKRSTFDPATQDNDASGNLTPGDELSYTITLTSVSTVDALDVSFTDTPDVNTTLVVGTVTTSRGTVVRGNTAGEQAVEVAVGTLLPGASATVGFEVTINDPLPSGVASILNQGLVSGSNFESVDTDDPDTTPAGDPTTDILGTVVPEPVRVPTLSGYLLILLALILGGLASYRLRRSV